jgi:hypothetical protein
MITTVCVAITAVALTVSLIVRVLAWLEDRQ